MSKTKINCSRNEFLYPHPVLTAGAFPGLDVESVCRYRSSSDLPARLADKFEVGVDLLRLHNGAEHALRAALAGCALMSDATLLVPSPGWNHYSVLARHYGLRIQPYRYREDGDTFALDIDELIEHVHQLDRPVLLLASPANPLGCRVPEDMLCRLVEVVAGKGYSIIDQTYFGYADVGNLDWALSMLLQNLPNSLIVRSLSKFYGMPALRTGFTVALPAVYKAFSLGTDYLGFNAYSELFAAECLRRHAEFAIIASEIVAQRRIISDAISSINGFTAYRSEANFVLLRTPSRSYAQWLGSHGIKVRQFSEGPLVDCIRLTIPPAEVVAEIIEITRRFDVSDTDVVR